MPQASPQHWITETDFIADTINNTLLVLFKEGLFYLRLVTLPSHWKEYRRPIPLGTLRSNRFWKQFHLIGKLFCWWECDELLVKSFLKTARNQAHLTIITITCLRGKSQLSQAHVQIEVIDPILFHRRSQVRVVTPPQVSVWDSLLRHLQAQSNQWLVLQIPPKPWSPCCYCKPEADRNYWLHPVRWEGYGGRRWLKGPDLAASH